MDALLHVTLIVVRICSIFSETKSSQGIGQGKKIGHNPCLHNKEWCAHAALHIKLNVQILVELSDVLV